MNALSDSLKLNIHKNGHEYFVEFKNGIAIHPLKKIGKSEKMVQL